MTDLQRLVTTLKGLFPKPAKDEEAGNNFITPPCGSTRVA